MHGSLTLRAGVLWVARSVRTARVRPFDLDGRPLGRGFAFAGQGGGRTEVRGIAADEDRRLWIADAGSPSVRAFTAFGVEVAEVESRGDAEADRPWCFGDCAGIAAEGMEADLRLLISRRGIRRHALALLDPAGGTLVSLRPGGDPQGAFAGLAGVALADRLAFACEAGAGTVQVFRDGEFHFRISLPLGAPSNLALEPRAVAALSDGRAVVACGGSGPSTLLSFDAGGSLRRVLATEGDGEGDVSDPIAVAIDPGESDRATRVVVLDRRGDRVQVFTLDGRCYGAFVDLDADLDRGRTGKRGQSGPQRRSGTGKRPEAR